MKRFASGITLIELMIVVVIVAILAGIAVPNYRQYVMRANRSEATAALLGIASAQEKFYLKNNTYASDAQLKTAISSGGLGYTSGTTERGWYSVTVAAPAGKTLTDGYTATAAAAAGKIQAADTQCTSFTITETGARDAVNSSSTSTKDTCWK